MPQTQMVVQNMPAKYAEEFNHARAYIANITEIEYTRSRTYGMFKIPGKADGEEFSLTEIGPRKGVMDMGDKHVNEFPIFPEEIAADLVREINADAGADSFLGVIVCGPEGPTEKELAAAHARLVRFAKWCVNQGDQEWQRTQRIFLIQDVWKRMATYLKLRRDWNAEIQPNLDCPGCGTQTKSGIAVCKECGCVIDREKAIRLGMIPPAPAGEETIEAGEQAAVTVHVRKPRTPKVS
jgi:hypothetical protein